MEELATVFITLGALLLIGLATDWLGRKTLLPRVTLLLLFGFLLGSSGLQILPQESLHWFPMISNMALLMVGFIMGGKLAFSFLRENGRVILWVSSSVVLITVIVIFAGLLALGFSLEIALLLAGIATATDPAATTDVIQENKAQGVFSDTLTGIVAIDDAWGLIAFSILLAIAQSFNTEQQALDALLVGGWELIGAVLLGIVLGVPMAYLSGRICPGQPSLVEALGMVFLCGGLALLLEVSFLLSAMVLGLVVTNLAKHHERPFHEIENIEWPFMILFFVLAGASLNMESLLQVGLLGGAYIVLRIVGRLAGSWPGGVLGGSSGAIKSWMGLGLLPQAGVAMGMALIAAQRFPELSATILPVVIAATVIFELIGPIGTRLALLRAGDIHNHQSG